MFDDLERQIKNALSEVEDAIVTIDDAEEGDLFQELWCSLADAKDNLKEALEHLWKARKGSKA